MSQVEFADKINVSKQTLYKYENDIITNIPSDKFVTEFVTEMVQYFFKKKLKNILTIRYEYDIIISSRRDKNQGGK